MKEIIIIIGGLIVLALVILTAVFAIKKRNNNDIKAAKEFLEGLGDELIGIILSTVKEIDPSTIDSVEEFELTILNSIYDKSWDYVVKEINSKLDDNSIIKTIVSIVDKEYVIKFIDTLCDKIGITEKIQGEYLSYQLSTKDFAKEDNKLIEEYSDDGKYYTTEVSEEDLEPAPEEIIHTEEEIAALNPQKDDDNEFNDECMEILPNEDEVGKVIAIKDKIGRWCFYQFDNNGKKSRISKTEAITKLKEQGGSEELLKELGL